jgi:hypothetical protein
MRFTRFRKRGSPAELAASRYARIEPSANNRTGGATHSTEDVDRIALSGLYCLVLATALRTIDCDPITGISLRRFAHNVRLAPLGSSIAPLIEHWRLEMALVSLNRQRSSPIKD